MKQFILACVLVLCTGCVTANRPEPVDYAQLYNNAMVALSVAEQGLATWELIATIQGTMTEAEISSHKQVWLERINSLRTQVEILATAMEK